jgi:glycosyltransferase involved in cell wall biosynthesis
LQKIENPPSDINPNIKWIFSSSLRRNQIEALSSGVKPVIDKENPILVTASRIEKAKGCDTLLASISILKQTYPNILLNVLGDGPYLPNLKQIANEKGISDNVIFHGKVNHETLLSVYQSSGLFCYPTRASEGFPKVVFEALAVGLPIITNPVSVLPDLLKSGAGIILKEDTPEEMASHIDFYINNRNKYEKSQSEAFNTAKSFSLEDWRDTIKSYLEPTWGKLKN